MEEKPLSYRRALVEILKIGLPAIVSLSSTLFVEVINTAFVGHLGSEAMMAGVGIANMFLNVIGLSVMFGVNGTLNTVVSQAFGQENYKLCGVYLNRARIIVTLLQVPLLAILFNARPLFDVLGFSDEAAFYSEQYIQIVAPGLYINALNDANKRMLNCMGY